jgi:hypothetical protein
MRPVPGCPLPGARACVPCLGPVPGAPCLGPAPGCALPGAPCLDVPRAWMPPAWSPVPASRAWAPRLEPRAWAPRLDAPVPGAPCWLLPRSSAQARSAVARLSAAQCPPTSGTPASPNSERRRACAPCHVRHFTASASGDQPVTSALRENKVRRAGKAFATRNALDSVVRRVWCAVSVRAVRRLGCGVRTQDMARTRGISIFTEF